MVPVNGLEKHYERWLKGFTRRMLNEPGAKSRLAEWLSCGDTSQIPRWKVSIARWTNQNVIPTAEISEALRAWEEIQAKKRERKSVIS